MTYDIIFDDSTGPLRKWGFGILDDEHTAYVFSAEYEDVLKAIQDTFQISQYFPDICGETIHLNSNRAALLYKLKDNDYTVFDAEFLCPKPELEIDLWQLSDKLPNSLAARFFTGSEAAGYAIYRNGLIDACFVPALTRIKYFEDYNDPDKVDQLMNKLDELNQDFGIITYYHLIDRKTDTDALIDRSTIVVNTPYSTGSKMEELSVYIPHFYNEKSLKEKAFDCFFSFEGVDCHVFDRIDCLVFDVDS